MTQKAKKICKVCTTPYPLTDEFWWRDGKGGWRPLCKDCINERQTLQREQREKERMETLLEDVDDVVTNPNYPEIEVTDDMIEDKNLKRARPRIVTLDIETAPLESYHWGLWDQNIGLEMVQVEWTILSFSAKWLGDDKVIYHDTGGNGVGKVRHDKPLLQELWNILDEADVVVAQNGQAFDLKKINARMLMLGFKPYSPVKIIDTMLVSKRHFSFTSNKLQWLSSHLTDAKKSEHKLFPGFELWSECLKDNPKAWAEMKKYNCIDTVATEELYLTLRPWIAGHVNVAVYNEDEASQCPKCGSLKVQMRGNSYTQTGKYQRIHCSECGGWSKTRSTENTIEKRKSLLSN